MTIFEKIITHTEAIYDEAVEIRRHIHAHPELSYQEFETSRYIQQKLGEYNIDFKAGYVKTGIVARVDGKLAGGKTIALRADMDALPIQEQNDVDYCSKNEGVMHACGHDVHSANLLATAKLLKELEDQFAGTILFIFQPAEEVNPGGALLMMEEGIFSDIQPEMVIGLHVLPDLAAGTVGFCAGKYMASGDEIYIDINGKGGHGALPHNTTDTVLAAANVITSLQQIVSRNAPSDIPTVLSFGKIVADGATNVIPSKVEISGTFRTMNEEWRAKAKERIKVIAQSTAQAYGTDADVRIEHGYPVLYNNEELTRKAKDISQKILGKENVVEMGLRMTCEDFAYYSLDYPVVFYRIGVGKPNSDETLALHTPRFDVDETALKTGIKSLASIAIHLLHS